MRAIKEELKVIVKTLDEKLASDIVVINVGDVNPLCEYFVVCTGNNERHLKALATDLRDCAEENELEFKRIEGQAGGNWTLVDLTDIVVHIFSEEGRSNYSLEKLWGDLEFVDVNTLLK